MLIAIDIPERVAIDVIESGFSYAKRTWAKDVRWQQYAAGHSALNVHEREPSRLYTAQIRTLPDAIARLAAIGPMHLCNIIRGSYDAFTGNALIQSWAFGELRYT